MKKLLLIIILSSFAHLKAMYNKQLKDLTLTPMLQATAEQGNVRSQFLMGLCYAERCGVERSIERAIHWFEKAAQEGYVEAQAYLAGLYEAMALQYGVIDQSSDPENFRKNRKPFAKQSFGTKKHLIGVILSHNLNLHN